MNVENSTIREHAGNNCLLPSRITDEIERLYKTPEKINRVIHLLLTAEQESRSKKIIQRRPPSRLKRFLASWHIRYKYGIHWPKPFYPFRIIRNFFLATFYHIIGSKKKVLRGLEFAITYRCNFKCSHCLCSRINETEKRQELSPEEYKSIVDQAMKLGATTFGMEGGEPFVQKNWQEFIQAWRPKYNHIIISSNGFLFDEEKAIQCRRLGVDTINFSLDSGIEEIHDLFRHRKGSFAKVMAAIDLCEKYGIKVILNTTVHKKNLYTRGFIDLLEFTEKRKLMVNLLFAKGVGEFKGKEAMLDDEDFASFEKIVAPYNYWHVHHEGKLKANYGTVGCPGLKEMINMTPYGDVIACANCHIYFGNVRNEPLEAIRERALQGSPYGKYRRCFLAQDKDFMNIYYGLLDKKGVGESYISLEEFHDGLRAYQKAHNRQIYPEINV